MKQTYKNSKNAKSRNLKTPLILLTLLGLSLSQALAPGIQIKPTATAKLLEVNGSDELLDWAPSLSKIAAVSKEGFLYTSTNQVGGATTVTPILPSSTRTNPPIDFQGSVDCWGNADRCVVCGIGGCYTVTFSGDTPVLNKIYFHKKFYPEATYNYDYVIDVLAMDDTNYFFTIEGIYGTNSGGLIRYNGDGTTANCYAQWSPKLTGSDQTNRRYIMKQLRFTKFLSVVPAVSQQIYIVDYTQISPTLTPIVSGKNFGSLVSNFQDYDHFAADNQNKVRFVVCGTVLSALCNIVEIPVTTTTGAPSGDPALPVNTAATPPRLYRTSIVTTTGANSVTAETPTPTVVRVKVAQESSKFFYVTYGRHFYIFEVKAFAAGAGGDVDAVLTTGFGISDAPSYIIMTDDRLYTKMALYSTNKAIYETNFPRVASQGQDDTKCHDAYVTTGAGDKCTGYYRAQDVAACSTAPWKASGLTNGVKCIWDIPTANRDKILGGTTSFNEKPNTLTFLTTSDVCTNTTRLNTAGDNPNDKLNNNRNSTSTSSNNTTLWIILGIVGGLILIGAVVGGIMMAGGSSAKKQQMMMQQQYMMGGGGMGGYGGQMGGMNNMGMNNMGMGGYGGQMGMVGNGMDNMGGMDDMSGMGGDNSFMGDMGQIEMQENSFIGGDDMSYNGGYNSDMGGGTPFVG